MTTQTPTTEERLSRLEGAYEQTNERLADLRADMNGRFADLRADMNEQLAALRAGMNSFRNTMLLMVGGVWATTVAGFIAILTTL